MSLLILMRHGKAEREHLAPSDRVRRLIARGRDDAAAAAAEIANQAFSPALVVSSSAARTHETADIVRGVLKVTAPVTLVEGLYVAAPETIWAAARRRLAEGVLLVGHNPGLHALVTTLLGRAGDRSALGRMFMEGFPTSAWVAFEVDDDTLESASARLIGGWSPKA